jgi:uncharacterized membrane protein
MTELDAELAAELEALPSAPRVGWRAVGVGLVLLAGLGFLAAFTLAAEKVRMLQDPAFEPSCNFNPILSCGSVMVTDQAAVLGFPNPFLGIAGFAIVITLGVVLAAGTSLPRWIVVGLALGSLAGAAFVHWLAYQSLYEIGALCPWCLVVWTVTLPIALWTTLLALRSAEPGRVWTAVWSVRYLLLLGWYLVFVVAILVRFWDYWSTLV